MTTHIATKRARSMTSMSLPRPSAAIAVAADSTVLAIDLVCQHVATAIAAVVAHTQLLVLLQAAASQQSRSDDTTTSNNNSSDRESEPHTSKTTYDTTADLHHSHRLITTTTSNSPNRGSDSVHQTGTQYRSNNAGDGPEKTRDRKSWFPRFKSNWLGTYRSKQMFYCCECAVVDAQSARYKGAEGKHCACGQDQWHLAKTIEEAEYNRRMEISKALGGLRYDEALERLKAMGTSESDLKRLRCGSDEASIASSCSSVDDHHSIDGSIDGSAAKRIKNEPSARHRVAPLPSPATRTYGSQLRRTASAPSSSFGLDPVSSATGPLTAELLQKINQQSFMYTPLNGDYADGPAAYDHLVPAPFADEESFGELLQGFLEDDPRSTSTSGYPTSYQQHLHSSSSSRYSSRSPGAAQYSSNSSTYASTPFLSGGSDPRYPLAPSTLPPSQPTTISDADFEFFPDGSLTQQHQHIHTHHHHHQLHRSTSVSSGLLAGSTGYFTQHLQQQQQQLPYSARPHLAHSQHSSIV